MSNQNSKGNSDGVFDPEKLIGETIAGRYLVERCIGRGGMGVVYLASQNTLNRRVVIKVLRSNLVEDDEAIARFEREAQGLSTLQHPNVVTIFDFGSDDERAYIVMEFVEGETLSRRLRSDGIFPFPRFQRVAAQILQGIGEAHKLDLLHRDIKPANIMLCERHGNNDFVKILDFGLAKLTSGGPSVTKEQSLVGSAAFLSPEQIVGLNEIDQRVDVYALGVLFYFMLSGKRPFSAENDTALLYKHVHEAPEPLAAALPEGHSVPPHVINLIHQCLAKNPRKRPRDANEVLAHLTSQVGGDAASNLMMMPWSQSADLTPKPQPNTFGEEFDDSDRMASLIGQSQSVSLVRMPDGNLQVIPVGNTSDSYSRDHSFILSSPQGKRSQVLPIVIVALLLVLVGGGGYFFATQGSGGSESKTAPTPSTAGDKGESAEAKLAEAIRNNLVADLKGLEEAVEGKNFKKVQNGVDDVLEVIAQHPNLEGRSELKAQAESYKSALDGFIQTTLTEAKQAEAESRYEEAMTGYQALMGLGYEGADKSYSAVLQAKVASSMKKDAKHGIFSVVSEPSGAKIKINGKAEKAPTPLSEREMLPGKYYVEVSLVGYKKWKKEIEIEAGGVFTEVVRLEKIQPTTTARRRPTKRPTKKPTKKPTTTTTTAKKEPVVKTTKKPKEGVSLPDSSGGGMLLPTEDSSSSGGDGLLPID